MLISAKSQKRGLKIIPVRCPQPPAHKLLRYAYSATSHDTSILVTPGRQLPIILFPRSQASRTKLVSTSLDQSVPNYDTILSMSGIQYDLCAILCSQNPWEQYPGCPNCWSVAQVRRLVAARLTEYTIVIAIAVVISYIICRRVTDDCVRKEKAA